MEGLSDSERRRAQNRENLRAHYGLARANTSSLSPLSESVKRPDTPRDNHVEQSKAQVTKEDPLDLDSPGFSPQQYYAKLVTTASLPDLIRQSTTLINDAKNLNSSRHSLVYNHHHQLFSAGDTISKLNAKTPQLQSIVNSLQESFNEISTLVESVELPKNSDDAEPTRSKP